MRNDGVAAAGAVASSAGQKLQQTVVQGGGPRAGKGNTGIIPTSFKALSSYFRIMSSGASTVASTVRTAASAASAMVERDTESSCDQVYWVGFDKLECEGGISRHVLLLAYRHGFQVWDVEGTDNVHNLVSRHDGPVSFMQFLPKPVVSKQSADKFAENRPLLMICADGSFSGGSSIYGGSANPGNGRFQRISESVNGHFVPTVVWFYSLKSQTYIHLMKFRSPVHLVRCSSQVVAILQASQIHCFDVATLEREYTILTNPVVTNFPGGGLGVGPLAVGPRWMAYSGSPVAASNPARVSPQHLTPSATFSSPASNGSLVAHYAKESSKHLAAGIVTLGDMGYKKLSRYCSELLPDGNVSQSGSSRLRVQGIANAHSDTDNVGMVIVRDTVSKTVIAQFRAHKSPISSLCFDPSGTLLVTASVQGHNINVFHIMPGLSSNASGADPESSYVHLYRLQRGLTNAVIQDICFSSDSQWVLVSSSRGTSHLFAISSPWGSVSFDDADASFSDRNGGSSVMSKPVSGGPVNSGPRVLDQQNISASRPPISLTVVSRIRSGSSGWRNTVSGAAAVATGKISSVSGAIASVFRFSNGTNIHADTSSLKTSYYLLIFSPSEGLVQYAMRWQSGLDSLRTLPGVDATNGLGFEAEERVHVEPIQKWNICQKSNRKDREDNIDIYGEHGFTDSGKVFPEGTKKENGGYPVTVRPITRHKLTSEERYHLYISEAEMQTRGVRIPLWAKSEVYFHSVVSDDINVNEVGGEIEIEKIPTRIIEARSKNLVPVYDYIQAPRFQPLRSYNNGKLSRQVSDVSENTKLSSWSSESLDSSKNGGAIAYQLYKGTGETALDGQMPTDIIKGLVNKNDRPEADTSVETVNNREGSVTGTQTKLVNNNLDGRGDQFD